MAAAGAAWAINSIKPIVRTRIIFVVLSLFIKVRSVLHLRSKLITLVALRRLKIMHSLLKSHYPPLFLLNLAINSLILMIIPLLFKLKLEICCLNL